MTLRRSPLLASLLVRALAGAPLASAPFAAALVVPIALGAGACDDAAADDDDDDDDDDGGEGEGEGGEGEGEFPVTPEARTLCEIVTRGQLNFIGAIARSASAGFTLRCSAEDGDDIDFPDEAEIAAGAEAACADDANPTVQVFAAAIAGGRVSFDVENIEACSALDLEELAAAGEPVLPGACVPTTLVEGNVEEGGACAGEWECAGELRCEAADLFVQELTCLPPAAPGEACVATPITSDLGGLFEDGILAARTCGPEAECVDFVCVALADIGEPCESGDECLDGLTCDFGAPEPVCIAQGDVGDACFSDDDCLEDLACAGDRCVEPLADGAPCVVGEDACDGDCSVCRPSTPGAVATTCQDRGAAGAGCASDDDCRHNFVCDTAAGACVAGGTDGDACITDDECATGFVCDAAVNACAEQPGVGDACVAGSDIPCAGDGVCVDGTCRAGLDGDPCENDDHCNDGLLCSSATSTCGEAPTSGACSVDGACADGFVCDAGQCVDPPALGDACTSEGRCGADAYCDEGTCVAQKGAGAACTADVECRAACANGTCTAEGVSCLTSRGFFPIVVLLSGLLPLSRRARRALAAARARRA